MKRKRLMLFSILLVISISFTAFAKNEKRTMKSDNAATSSTTAADLGGYSVFCPLSKTDDFIEIKTLEPEMLERANVLYEFGKLKEKMVSSDIVYDKAIKIYMDEGDRAFDILMGNLNEFQEFLDTAEYIWELQVDIGNQTVTYTFNIGRKASEEAKKVLTSEEIAKLEQDAGHWKIVKVAWGSEKGMDYKDYIKKGMENERMKSLKRQDGIQPLSNNSIEIYELNEYLRLLE